ncbi:MAG: Rne/Rng family ribonuclease [Gammaproteobacteria bacterium]|nr:Rne/Rng family ribonuclease [Gammaproteobacteria bacterium]
MSEELLVDTNAFETRIALLRDGEPVEIHLQRPARDPKAEPGSLVGNIYLGRIARVAPAIQAAFVDIGTQTLGALFNEPHGTDFDTAAIPRGTSGTRSVREGDHILVQVAKEPLKGRGGGHGKGPRLSANPSLVGRYVVAFPLAARGGREGVVDEDGPGERVNLSRRLVADDERSRLGALAADVLQDLGLPWDCIVRTAAAGATRAEIADDLAYLCRLWQRIRQRRERAREAPTLLFQELPATLRTVRDLAGPALSRILVNDDDACAAVRRHVEAHFPVYRDKVVHYRSTQPLFDAFGVEAAVEAILDPRAELPSGGQLVIEHTEAMTTIDVDSGTALDSASRADTALVTNLEAARAIPRQLRLRNIGGIVVVDFISMVSDEHRDIVHRTLLEAAKGDPARFTASGFSDLGLVEISRRRIRDSLLSQLSGNCPDCVGRGYAKSAQSTCFDIFRTLLRRTAVDGPGLSSYVLHAAEAVVDRLLDEDAHHLAALVSRTRRPVELQVEPAYRNDQFDLIGVPRPGTETA